MWCRGCATQLSHSCVLLSRHGLHLFPVPWHWVLTRGWILRTVVPFVHTSTCCPLALRMVHLVRWIDVVMMPHTEAMVDVGLSLSFSSTNWFLFFLSWIGDLLPSTPWDRLLHLRSVDPSSFVGISVVRSTLPFLRIHCGWVSPYGSPNGMDETRHRDRTIEDPSTRTSVQPNALCGRPTSTHGIGTDPTDGTAASIVPRAYAT